MSGFKGTPGPWEGKEVSICRQDDAGLHLGFLSTGCEVRRAEGLANAHLICSAPELLEALQGLVFLYEDDEGCRELTEYKRAKKAINKALGVSDE